MANVGKGNPASKRASNPKVKAKRITNRNRNDKVQGFNSLTRQRNYRNAHKRDGVKKAAAAQEWTTQWN